MKKLKPVANQSVTINGKYSLKVNQTLTSDLQFSNSCKNFEMLHDHVVAKTISFVPVLPVVHVVVEDLFVESIHVNTIPGKNICE